jgi:hypothetical protein
MNESLILALLVVVLAVVLFLVPVGIVYVDKVEQRALKRAREPLKPRQGPVGNVGRRGLVYDTPWVSRYEWVTTTTTTYPSHEDAPSPETKEESVKKEPPKEEPKPEKIKTRFDLIG